MNIIYLALFQFSIVGLILLVLSYKRQSLRPIYVALLLCVFFLFDAIILHLPKSHFFSGLHWNWQGKLLEFLWPLILVYIFKWFTPNEVGLRLPKSSWSFLYVAVISLIYVIFAFTLCTFTGGLPNLNDTNNESLIYQFTMPGLSEELFFRGTLWAIIARYLQAPIRILKYNISWSFILTTILFIMVHLIKMNESGQIEWLWWDSMAIVIPAVMLGLTRLKTASILPCVVLHNLLNGLYLLIVRILYY